MRILEIIKTLENHIEKGIVDNEKTNHAKRGES